MNTVSPESATFSKATPADVVLTVSSNTANTVTAVKLGSAAVASENYTIEGLVVTLDSTYLATLAESAHTFNIELQKGNAVSSIITVTA